MIFHSKLLRSFWGPFSTFGPIDFSRKVLGRMPFVPKIAPYIKIFRPIDECDGAEIYPLLLLPVLVEASL